MTEYDPYDIFNDIFPIAEKNRISSLKSVNIMPQKMIPWRKQFSVF